MDVTVTRADRLGQQQHWVAVGQSHIGGYKARDWRLGHTEISDRGQWPLGRGQTLSVDTRLAPGEV